jgi:predicted negative regulator of RcsB-dependent stress response
LDEYSDSEQWELLKAKIREYGAWVLGGIVLGGLAVGGFFAWQSHVDNVAQAASQKYEEMRLAFAKGDRTNALLTLGELERDYGSTPYVDQAKLTAARAYVDSGDLDKAASELTKVATSSKDADLARIARLRLARVQIAQKKPDAALATLGAVQEPGAFEPKYHEARGDAYYAKGDKASALKEYRTARATDLEGLSERSLLDLKISDLAADAAPAASAPKTDAAPPAK